MGAGLQREFWGPSSVHNKGLGVSRTPAVVRLLGLPSPYLGQGLRPLLGLPSLGCAADHPQPRPALPADLCVRKAKEGPLKRPECRCVVRWAALCPHTWVAVLTRLP